MGNAIECFPTQDRDRPSRRNLTPQEKLTQYETAFDDDKRYVERVDGLIQDLKRKQNQHQETLAYCQELHMENEELKTKIKQTKGDLAEKQDDLSRANEQIKVKTSDAEVYKAQLEEKSLQLEQMELLKEQLIAVTRERNELSDRNRNLEQQIFDAISLSTRRIALSTDGDGKSLISTEDGKSTIDIEMDVSTSKTTAVVSDPESPLPPQPKQVSFKASDAEDLEKTARGKAQVEEESSEVNKQSLSESELPDAGSTPSSGDEKEEQTNVTDQEAQTEDTRQEVDGSHEVLDYSQTSIKNGRYPSNESWELTLQLTEPLEHLEAHLDEFGLD